MLLETTYVGNVGHHLLRQPNINTPHIASSSPPTLPITPTSTTPTRASPPSARTAATPTPTTTRCRSTSPSARELSPSPPATPSPRRLGDSSSNNGDLANWQDLNYNYGELNIDRKHAFVTTVNYQVPDFRGHNMLLREGVGGFMVTGVFRVQSGPFYTINATAPTLGTRRASHRSRAVTSTPRAPAARLPGT